MAEYSTDFQITLEDAGWDERAAIFFFRQGLNPNVKKLLLSMPQPQSLQNLFHTLIKPIYSLPNILVNLLKPIIDRAQPRHH